MHSLKKVENPIDGLPDLTILDARFRTKPGNTNPHRTDANRKDNMKQKPITNLEMKEALSAFIGEATSLLTANHLPPQIRIMGMKALLFALLKELEKWETAASETLESYTRNLLLISRN